MIYRIAEAPQGGKGVVGIYPRWDVEDGDADARLLGSLRSQYVTVLFIRNNIGAFFDRIAPAFRAYAHLVDLVCGWELERVRMFFLPFNPSVEVLPLSAMHFNGFDLLEQACRASAGQEKLFDVFFAVSRRPDGLKNEERLGRLLIGVSRRLSVVGYGRLTDDVLGRIAGNPRLEFSWRGKAAVTSPTERLSFLTTLARSRCVLITSRVEGYSRLAGEALCLGVPVLLPADILCDNWPHLNATNSRLFVEPLFDRCLDDVLSREWTFRRVEFADGNRVLRERVNAYLAHRQLPAPSVWHTLGYGALTDELVHEE